MTKVVILAVTEIATVIATVIATWAATVDVTRPVMRVATKAVCQVAMKVAIRVVLVLVHQCPVPIATKVVTKLVRQAVMFVLTVQVQMAVQAVPSRVIFVRSMIGVAFVYLVAGQAIRGIRVYQDWNNLVLGMISFKVRGLDLKSFHLSLVIIQEFIRIRFWERLRFRKMFASKIFSNQVGEVMQKFIKKA